MIEQVCLEQIANSNIHYRFFPFSEFLMHQKRLGVNRIDLFGADPHVWIDAYGASDGKALRRQAENYGISISTFTPELQSMRYTLGSEGRSSVKTWEYLKLCFTFACEVGTNQVLISTEGFLLDQSEEVRWDRLIHTCGRLSRLADSYGLTLLLLNHYADRTSMIRTKEDMKRCLAVLSEERTWKPAVDTASVYEAGESIEEWFACFGRKIGYIGLSNSMLDGSRRCWGDGYLNLWEILEVMRRNGYKGNAGTVCMVRDYLAQPWNADERSRKQLRLVMEGLSDRTGG